MFTSILVPIDTMHESSWVHALPEAIAMGQGAKLTVLTVVPDVALMFQGVHFGFELEAIVQDARKKLAEIAASYAGPGREIDAVVKVGSIGREILNLAEDRGADLIVMESHRPEMKDYLIGPNAAHVARHAKCSVLVLRKAAAGTKSE